GLRCATRTPESRRQRTETCSEHRRLVTFVARAVDRAALVRDDARCGDGFFLVVAGHDDAPVEYVKDVRRPVVGVGVDARAGTERERLHEHVVGRVEFCGQHFVLGGVEVGVDIEHTRTASAVGVALPANEGDYTPADRFEDMEYVTVRDTEIPALGFGTWRTSGPTCRRAVATALDVGYRHID